MRKLPLARMVEGALNNFMINTLYMSWLTRGSEMALQDMIMANTRLNNVLFN